MIARVIWVALACAAGCRFADVSFVGKQCPCPGDLVCDGATQTCQLVATPDDAAIDAAPIAQPSCTGSNLIFCDDFERIQPIATNDTRWVAKTCDTGATLAVDGMLKISAPAVGNNQDFVCVLSSVTTPLFSRYQVDFDLTATSVSTTFAVAFNMFIQLGTPNAAGVDAESFQVLLQGDGTSNVSLVFHFPDASKSPTGTNYPGYDIADEDGTPFFRPGSACHFTYIFAPLAETATGEATCNGATHTLTQRTRSMPAGLGSAPSVNLGYDSASNALAPWTLAYDNFVMRGLP